jgi:putative sterol carrier protein
VSTSTIQYRLIVGKKDEIVDGPDDADLVITVPLADALADGFDPTVAFMQGKLKSTGSTGSLFDLLRSGAAATALSRLASGASRP